MALELKALETETANQITSAGGLSFFSADGRRGRTERDSRNREVGLHTITAKLWLERD